MRLLICLCTLLLTVTMANARPLRVAALELTMGKGTPTDARGYLTDVVRTAALTLPTKRYFILTRENLLEALPPGKDLAACEGSCEVETGRNIGADYVISGEIIALGRSLKVALKLFQTRDGRLLGARHATAAGPDNIEEAVHTAAAGIVELLREAGPTPTARGARAAVRNTPTYAVGPWRVHISAGALPTLYIWQGAHGAVAVELDTGANGWWRLKRGAQTLHIESAQSQRASILDHQPWRGATRTPGELTTVRVPLQRAWTGAHGRTRLALDLDQITVHLPDGGKIRLSREGTKVLYEDAKGRERSF